MKKNKMCFLILFIILVGVAFVVYDPLNMFATEGEGSFEQYDIRFKFHIPVVQPDDPTQITITVYQGTDSLTSLDVININVGWHDNVWMYGDTLYLSTYQNLKFQLTTNGKVLHITTFDPDLVPITAGTNWTYACMDDNNHLIANLDMEWIVK